jgi:hypothetical protein
MPFAILPEKIIPTETQQMMHLLRTQQTTLVGQIEIGPVEDISVFLVGGCGRRRRNLGVSPGVLQEANSS